MIQRIATVNLDAAAHRLGLKIKVRGLKALGIRLSLSAAIFRFAGFVAGVPVEIDTESHPNLVLLDEAERQIDRRAGCVYVSTHAQVGPDGQQWRTWARIKLTD